MSHTNIESKHDNPLGASSQISYSIVFFFFFGRAGSSLWYEASLLLHAGFLQLWSLGFPGCTVWASAWAGAAVAAPRPLSSWHTGSLLVVLGFSCSKAWGILVPQPGIKTMSPALEGRFLITGLPGKSLRVIINLKFYTKSDHWSSIRRECIFKHKILK